MRTLCLYYSRTGLTKKAMEQLAKQMDADLFEYTDGKDRAGVLGYIGACIDSFRRTLPKVTIQGSPDLGAYDRVFVGMPVWAEGPSVVGRALLSQCGPDLPKDVFYVVTHMAKADYQKKIKALDTLLGRPSKGMCSLQTKDHDYLAQLQMFIDGLANADIDES